MSGAAEHVEIRPYEPADQAGFAQLVATVLAEFDFHVDPILEADLGHPEISCSHDSRTGPLRIGWFLPDGYPHRSGGQRLTLRAPLQARSRVRVHQSSLAAPRQRAITFAPWLGWRSVERLPS
jgi:hypothetical protein